MIKKYRLAKFAFIVLAASTLANCTDKDIKQRITGRWGPNSEIQPGEFSDAIKRQMMVLQYIADGANIPVTVDVNGQRQLVGSSPQWMSVVEAGFNIGREDCDVYMGNLFRMARERQRNDSVINAAGVASNAILNATNAGHAVSIVGASLGMLTGFNDAVYDSYLFAQAPSLIGQKVADVQAAYRDKIETGPPITNPQVAYNAIQSYYSYCLPASIEGMMLQTVAGAAPTVPTPAAPTKTTAASAPVSATPPPSSINARVKLQ